MMPLSGSDWFHNVIAGGRERPYTSQTHVVGEASVVAVSGEMDLSTATRFRQDLDEAMAFTCGDLVLDLSDLDMIDSTALGVMLGRTPAPLGRGQVAHPRSDSGVRPADPPHHRAADDVPHRPEQE